MLKDLKPGRKYFIINIDEPYAEEIYEVLKRGQMHKGEWPEGDISFEEWQEQTFTNEPLFDEQACRVCGCTWDNACEGGCYWVEDDLCNKCEDLEIKKMFKINEDGIPEWVVPTSKKEAFEFIDKIWGGMGVNEYYAEEKADNPNLSLDMFIENFIVEEPYNKLFTMDYGNCNIVTKSIQEFLNEVNEVPSYFACSDW